MTLEFFRRCRRVAITASDVRALDALRKLHALCQAVVRSVEDFSGFGVHRFAGAFAAQAQRENRRGRSSSRASRSKVSVSVSVGWISGGDQ